MNVKEWNEVHQRNGVDGLAQGHPRRSYGVSCNGWLYGFPCEKVEGGRTEGRSEGNQKGGGLVPGGDRHSYGGSCARSSRPRCDGLRGWPFVFPCEKVGGWRGVCVRYDGGGSHRSLLPPRMVERRAPLIPGGLIRGP